MMMPRLHFSVILITLLLALNKPLYPLSFLQCDGRTIADSTGSPVYLRGIGLGGWLVPEGYMLHIPGFGSPTDIRNKIEDVLGATDSERFWKNYRQNYVNRHDIEAIAGWGFNSIRLPFHYDLFYDEELQSFKEQGFKLVDSLVAWCRASDLYLILDMHCAPGGQNNGNISDSDGEVARLWTDEANKDLTVLIWKEIASRYAEEAVIAGYDLLNEPVLPEGYGTTDLRALYMRLTRAIREVDSAHIIFVEGNIYATNFNDLTPPWAANLVYSFHKYWNEPNKASIEFALDVRKRFNVPLWLGESGENSNPWFHRTVQLMESNDIGWCWWTHKKFQTTTSPLSARLPSGWQQLRDYWNGREAKPSRETAKAILMQMVENLRLDECVPRPGVLPALFDARFGQEARPFSEHTLPCTVKAVHYDIGDNQTAYNDADFIKTRWDVDQPWNRGSRYRNDGVDIEKSDDAHTPFSVGWLEPDEWMQYTVRSPQAAVYRATFRYASPQGEGGFRLNTDEGQQLLSVNDLPATEGWYAWDTITSKQTFKLNEGLHRLRFEVLAGSFNLSQIVIEHVSNGGMGSDDPNIDGFQLGQNYPNPFNRQTVIPVQLQSFQPFQLNIYGIDGTLIKRLPTESEGVNHEIKWQGRDLSGRSVSSGLYLYQLDIGDRQKTRKMVLIK